VVALGRRWHYLSAITGATSPTYTTEVLTPGDDGAVFEAVFTSTGGSR
jgi:hypothetical protein